MLAGNAIKLTGKIARTPIHLISGIFNKCCKWAGSDTRWRMDSFKDTWRKGWVNYNDGRNAFRNIIKGTVIFPVFSVCEVLFMHVLCGKYLTDRDPSTVVKNYGSFLKGIGGKHLNHIIKGMGITSKHYKDRSMLTREEGGNIADEPESDDYDD